MAASIDMKTKKTPKIRAQELFGMVHGRAWSDFLTPSNGYYSGWLKLGKFVLSLETKWTKAKRK